MEVGGPRRNIGVRQYNCVYYPWPKNGGKARWHIVAYGDVYTSCFVVFVLLVENQKTRSSEVDIETIVTKSFSLTAKLHRVYVVIDNHSCKRQLTNVATSLTSFAEAMLNLGLARHIEFVPCPPHSCQKSKSIEAGTAPTKSVGAGCGH